MGTPAPAHDQILVQLWTTYTLIPRVTVSAFRTVDTKTRKEGPGHLQPLYPPRLADEAAQAPSPEWSTPLTLSQPGERSSEFKVGAKKTGNVHFTGLHFCHTVFMITQICKIVGKIAQAWEGAWPVLAPVRAEPRLHALINHHRRPVRAVLLDPTAQMMGGQILVEVQLRT